VTEISLLGVASDLPAAIVSNEAFAPGTTERRGMFTAPTTRHHVARDETAVDMIERAARTLLRKLAVDPADISLVFTNVAIPDQAFTGCGAEVAHRIGARPRFVIDLHNSGCVAFIYMMELARELLASGDRRGALLCCVQNAGGRVFSNPQLRSTSQAPVPGDGCGVGYVIPGGASRVLSIVHEIHGEHAPDMVASAPDGRRYWEPGTSAITLGFTEARVASIIHRGNQLVPDVVAAACRAAGTAPRELDLLVTNQPNPIFLRNWREALDVPRERHVDTYDRNGNLFAAAIPINLEAAIAAGMARRGDRIALGGFAHAGDYAAAAVLEGPVI